MTSYGHILGRDHFELSMILKSLSLSLSLSVTLSIMHSLCSMLEKDDLVPKQKIIKM